MKIISVVVDEMPSCCFDCDFVFYQYWKPELLYRCRLTLDVTSSKHGHNKKRADNCPLKIEDE